MILFASFSKQFYTFSIVRISIYIIYSINLKLQTDIVLKKTLPFWILAVFLTLTSAVYQRLTGPSHPIRGSVVIEKTKISYKLPRTQVTSSEAEIKIKCSVDARGEIKWRRFRSNDEWIISKLDRDAELLTASIPIQPSAGKVAYTITLIDNSGMRYDLTDVPVLIRYKDPVPPYILAPHIIFMLIAMLLSLRTGFEAMANGSNTRILTFITVISLALGGMILGPIVQKFAFGAFWTGWPFGHDLTDNKTAVALIFWLISLWRGRNPGKGRYWIITASVITFIIFLIPHSLLGSEIDYTTME
jgi:hypothetical protein